MAQIVLKQTSYLLRKKMVTVGTDPGHDLIVGSADAQAQLDFTLRENEGRYELMPAGAKVRINGQSVSRATRLGPCDRIEWKQNVAVFLANDLPHEGSRSPASASRSLDLLHNLAGTLQQPGSLPAALRQVLDALTAMADAEIGYLLTESSDGSSWQCLASQGEPNRRELFSETILQEALKKREPVYVENMVGHPWSSAESVISARIFSAACFPLIVGERVFGAVFLLTRSPGKSIRRETLGETSLFATQAALMLASQAELSKARQENERLRRLLPDSTSSLVFERMDSDSPMAELERKIQKLAPTPLSVLILGETGTGKEVVARELHRLSPRSKEPFVAVNCAAIPATLLEATLFGFEKGAFTGAVRAQTGKFAQADGGTLLLDEIGDMPLELQAKLLRVLQEKHVEPLGSARPVPIDVRVLAATHTDLEKAVEQGRFRQDLYFRLYGSVLRIPALRNHSRDIPALTNHFLGRLVLTQGSAPLCLSQEALSLLQKHSWPGNIRELEQVITRAGLMASGSEIRSEDLELSALPTYRAGEADLELQTLQDAQSAFTRGYIQRALRQNSGNREETALRLGISERTLYRILAEDADRTGRGV